jgi:hypothetical protein
MKRKAFWALSAVGMTTVLTGAEKSKTMQSVKQIFSKSTTMGRILLFRFGSKLLLGMFLAGGFIHSGSAQQTPPFKVSVWVGYLNNVTGQPVQDPKVTPPIDDLNTTLIASGPATTPHDTGVIKFQNDGTFPVQIDQVTVTTENGQQVFRIWDDKLPFVTVEPGKSLVLAETQNFNFDSSNFGLDSDPVVSGTVRTLSSLADDMPFKFTDTRRVLLGHEDIGNTLETTPYGDVSLGDVTPPIKVIQGSALVPTSFRCDGADITNFGNTAGQMKIIEVWADPGHQPVNVTSSFDITVGPGQKESFAWHVTGAPGEELHIEARLLDVTNNNEIDQGVSGCLP